MERVNRSVIFNRGANGSGTRPRRQGFVIVTLQAALALRLRYCDRIRGKKATRISIFGSGYVGLVQAAEFSEVGHQVTCMNRDPTRVARIQNGDLPFHEPSLNELVQAGIAQGTLRFTDDAAEAVEASEYLFICAVTPAATDGSADL